MTENHYTPEQMEKIKKQGELLGPEKIKEVEAEWPRLIAAVKAEMEKGTDPSDPAVQKLAARWKELIEMFTGGDPGVTKSLGTVWEKDGDKLRQEHGDSAPNPELMQYIQKAMNSGKD